MTSRDFYTEWSEKSLVDQRHLLRDLLSDINPNRVPETYSTIFHELVMVERQLRRLADGRYPLSAIPGYNRVETL